MFRPPIVSDLQKSALSLPISLKHSDGDALKSVHQRDAAQSVRDGRELPIRRQNHRAGRTTQVAQPEPQAHVVHGMRCVACLCVLIGSWVAASDPAAKIKNNWQ